MKDGFLPIALASPKIKVADPRYNLERCVEAAEEAERSGAAVVVFPELTLSAITCGDLFYQSALLGGCEAAAVEYVRRTAELDIISFIGLPVRIGSALYDCSVAVSRGRILGVSTLSCDGLSFSDMRKRYFSSFGTVEEIELFGEKVLIGENLIYSLVGEPRAKIFVSVGGDNLAPVSAASYAASQGAELIVSVTGYHETLSSGKREYLAAISESARLCAAYAVCCASYSESGTDGVFAQRRIISELGECVTDQPLFSDDIAYGVVDIEKIRAERSHRGGFDGRDGELVTVDVDLSPRVADPAPPHRFPFIPADIEEREAACALGLDIQARALAGRIERARARTCVLGVSGGLDSTLAVLVCAGAMKHLGRSGESVIAVTMPCFGTTERTKGNALLLAEELGLSTRTIDIKAAVEQHFKDIGQPEGKYDVVYENSQARERTQILMDIANMENGLVVGTGDLSEIALGFATYNGDHMSMYSVNGSVPKTLMREMIRYAAKAAYKKGREVLAKVLLDVIDTPVSPELLPTDGKEVSQPTESIVGPYELHDFFIYYTVKYGTSARKLIRLASLAFDGKYTREEIVKYYRIFTRRFTTSQFKRSCMPDGPIVTDISLSPRGGFVMPSDASVDAFFFEEE